MFRKRLHRLRFRFAFHATTQTRSHSSHSPPCIATTAQAQSANIRGKILDPLGNPVAQAKVTLVQEGREDKSLADSTSTADGTYSTRTRPTAVATPFASKPPASIPKPPNSFTSASNKSADIDVNLRIGTLTQQIVVSATGTPTLETQVGASVSVIDHSDLENQHQLNVADALRLLPGPANRDNRPARRHHLSVVRGGQSDFNKVLIDGIPANDIGGAFDFGDLSSTAVDQVEILRGPNSVLYGPDAIASVINVTTPHGTTIEPEFNYSHRRRKFRHLPQRRLRLRRIPPIRLFLRILPLRHAQQPSQQRLSRCHLRRKFRLDSHLDHRRPLHRSPHRHRTRQSQRSRLLRHPRRFLSARSLHLLGSHAPESNHQEVAQHPEVRLRSAKRELSTIPRRPANRSIPSASARTTSATSSPSKAPTVSASLARPFSISAVSIRASSTPKRRAAPSTLNPTISSFRSHRHRRLPLRKRKRLHRFQRLAFSRRPQQLQHLPPGQRQPRSSPLRIRRRRLRKQRRLRLRCHAARFRRLLSPPSGQSGILRRHKTEIQFWKGNYRTQHLQSRRIALRLAFRCRRRARRSSTTITSRPSAPSAAAASISASSKISFTIALASASLSFTTTTTT